LGARGEQVTEELGVLALQFCRGFQHRIVRTKSFEVIERRFTLRMQVLGLHRFRFRRKRAHTGA